jgi:short-subunit dehydrogenase
VLAATSQHHISRNCLLHMQIGLAIAQQLARQGLNLVLVSRSADKLAAAAATLPPGVTSVTLPLDLTSPGATKKLLEATKDLPVSVVIANAGGGLSCFKAFWEQPQKDMDYVKDLNGTQTYQLLHGIIPRLLARGKGAIVVISSLATYIPAYLTPYAAEKAKMDVLATGLAQELAGSGITVQSFKYGGVITPQYMKLSNSFPSNSSGSSSSGSTSSSSSSAAAPKPSITSPLPEMVAVPTVAAIGLSATGHVFTPYWGHALQEGILTSLWPHTLQRWALDALARLTGKHLAQKAAAVAGAKA